MSLSLSICHDGSTMETPLYLCDRRAHGKWKNCLGDTFFESCVRNDDATPPPPPPTLPVRRLFGVMESGKLVTAS